MQPHENVSWGGAAAGRNSQHEVLLPAWLVSTHGDGGALHILHLQSHIGVEFVCENRERNSQGSVIFSCWRFNQPLLKWGQVFLPNQCEINLQSSWKKHVLYLSSYSGIYQLLFSFFSPIPQRHLDLDFWKLLSFPCYSDIHVSSHRWGHFLPAATAPLSPHSGTRDPNSWTHPFFWDSLWLKSAFLTFYFF